MKNIGKMCYFTMFMALAAGPAHSSDLLESGSPETFSQASVTEVKISPSGDFLAIRVLQFGKYKLHFLDRETLANLGELAFSQNREVGEFHWANDERVVAEVHELSANGEESHYSGELVAANYNGGLVSQIQLGSHLQGASPIKVVDPLPDNSKNILISSMPMASANGIRGMAVLLNVYNDVEERQFTLMPETHTQFYSDGNGEIQIIEHQNTAGIKNSKISKGNLTNHLGASLTKTGF